MIGSTVKIHDKIVVNSDGLKVKGQLLKPKQETAESHRDYPNLDCPICDTSCKPIRLRKDQAVTYTCKGGNDKHSDRYTWRIAVDGTLID